MVSLTLNEARKLYIRLWGERCLSFVRKPI